MSAAEISSIVPEDVEAPFDCGVHSLNGFLARHALGNHKAGVGKTYVLRRVPPPPRVIGYSTVAMSSASSAELGAAEKQRLPKYPIPVGLVGRLAVQLAEKGQGWGERLLVHALATILDASEKIGGVGVLVDALDNSAASFYGRYGFQALDPSAEFPRRMYLPISTVRVLTARSSSTSQSAGVASS